MIQSSVQRLTLVLALVFFCAPAFADDWQYTIRPGDDLWSLARTHCGKAAMAQQIAEHNGLANPARIRAGQRINIPTEWLVFEPSVARIEHVTGLVRVQQRSDYASPQSRARAGSVLQMGYVLITEEGAALVRFADNSTLSIAPRSRVLFNKLTAFGPAGMVDTHLRFAYGNGRARVQPQNRGDRFRIQTPEGIAAVRGTEFRVGHTPDDPNATGETDAPGVSNTETLTGAVDFVQTNLTTNVPAGYGVAASPRGVVKETLLPPPTGLNATPALNVGDTLGWDAISGAASYTIAWAHAAQPDVSFAQVSAPTPAVEVTLEPGDYIVSVRGTSAAGIEGQDAHHPLKVSAKPLPPAQPTGLHATIARRSMTINWQPDPNVDAYRLRVLHHDTGETVLEVTDANLQSPMTLELDAYGAYEIELVSLRDSLQSEPATTLVTRPWPPWWLLILLIPLAAL